MARFSLPRGRSDVGASVRRLRTRGRDPLVLVAAALVAATLLFAMLTVGHSRSGAYAAPVRSQLRSAVRVCPPTPAASTIRVASLGKAGGPITSQKPGATPAPAGQVAALHTTDIPAGTDELAVNARGPVAGGLLVGRYGSAPLTGTRCTEFDSDNNEFTGGYWFTGLGAASTHYSVIHVDNPTDTPAVVQFTMLWSQGPLDIPKLDALNVPAHGSVAYNMYTESPHYGEFGVHAQVVQGQALVSVLDTLQTPGQPPASEWLVPQSAPTERVTLLGLPAGTRQVLTVANPGPDQVTATIRLITKTSAFAPANFAGLTVPGGGAMSSDDPTQKSVDLARILSTAKDVIGIEVSSTAPITASLSTIADGDLVFTGAVPLLSAEGGVVLPDGPKRIVLRADEESGPVTVISRDAQGVIVAQNTVEVPSAGAATLGLPANAALVQVLTKGARIRAAAVVTDHGSVVVPLGRVIRVSSVPFVRPGVD